LELLPHVPPQVFGVPVGFDVDVAVADADDVDVAVGEELEVDVAVAVGVALEIVNAKDRVQATGVAVGMTS
jgi:hypothetical protein